MSGIRPTGFLHLGNYFGALRNYVRMQDEYDCYFMVADLHSLTTHPDTKDLKLNVQHVLSENIACGLDPDKVALFCQSHVYETSELYLYLNMMAYTGATLVALHRFDVETALRAIQQYRCTITTLIATVNVAIVNHPKTPEYDLGSLRLCTSGGAPVPPEIARRWEAITGHRLVEGYGLTETTAPSHSNPPHRPRYGTVGVPLPFTGVRIVSLDDGATELPLGESGEITVRGPMVTKGYWRRPDATAEAIQDGWLRTGDVGRVDEEGYFTIEERKKDMIKASGYSVFPAEVEAIMYRHPAVAEVGVVGVPDAYRGEDVLAFVVRQPEARATERELVEWCRAKMAVYKAPRAVRFVPALPKTASGKIVKRTLREQARDAAG